MAKRLFVGSLPYQTTGFQLEELFSQFGKVESVNVITDRYSGQGKGFAFVEMTSDAEAQKAITNLNGKEFQGRALVVNEARPQGDRGGSRGFGGGNRGGYKKGGFEKSRRW